MEEANDVCMSINFFFSSNRGRSVIAVVSLAVLSVKLNKVDISTNILFQTKPFQSALIAE